MENCFLTPTPNPRKFIVNGANMTNKTSKFKCGDKIRVTEGITDPDFMTSIEGWSGEIDEIEILDNGSWMCRVIWDKETLQKVGDDYISRCEDENLDYEHIYLLENDLELIENNDYDNKPEIFIA